MALIEGVGDEVTLLFAVVLLLVVLILAWISTHTAERLPSHWGPPVTEPAGTSASSQQTSSILTSSFPGVGTDLVTTNSEHSCVDLLSISPIPEPVCVQSVHAHSDPSRNTDPNARLSASNPAESSTDPSPSTDSTVNSRDPSHITDPTDKNQVPSPSTEPREHLTNTDPNSSNEDLSDSAHNSEPTRRSNDCPNTPPTLRHRGPNDPAGQSPTQGAGTIGLRLKFLNDTERLLCVRPSDTLLHIKRTHFPGQEPRVRFIYQGQLLRDDTQTVSALQLRDGCVLHCHIAQHTSGQGPGGPEMVHVPLNIGSLLVPLLGLILILLWYYQLQYPYVFTTTATACLGGVTLLVSVVAFSSYRR
ncbi:transmembrane and ubiquitin-like domain-containing protein 1 [Pelodytes ibericus]